MSRRRGVKTHVALIILRNSSTSADLWDNRKSHSLAQTSGYITKKCVGVCVCVCAHLFDTCNGFRYPALPRSRQPRIWNKAALFFCLVGSL